MIARADGPFSFMNPLLPVTLRVHLCLTFCFRSRIGEECLTSISAIVENTAEVSSGNCRLFQLY